MAKKGKFKPKHRSEPLNPTKKINPFELHVNRSKYDVIGQKSKTDRGLPGIARAKANKKRERTLLEEYKVRNKSNVFVDRRIGENDSSMDPEKKMSLRMAAEKRNNFSKKSLFNLNDDEELTHGGRALDDNNMKEALDFSGDEDEDMLDAKYVRDQHFGGGGFLTKRNEEGSADDKNKSRKDWIDEIIAESKRKKDEAKKDKEEQIETVSKLNENLQSFMQMMLSHKLTIDDNEKEKKKAEFADYDVLVKELIFDRSRKAQPSDRLKTPEELAKIQREKLLALEADRVRRMKGEVADNKKAEKFQSADMLDDGFSFDKDDRYHVSYKEGKLITEDSEHIDEEEEANGEKNNSKQKEVDDNDQESNEDEEESDDDSDKYSDILEEDEADVDEVEDPLEGTKSKPGVEDIKDIVKKQDIIAAAKKEIPYVFEVPQDYEAFWALVEGHTPGEVSIILDRMIACNHPSIGGKNKDRCEDIFAYLLQTLYVFCGEDSDSPIDGVNPMMYVDALVPPLYDLIHLSPQNSSNALSQVIDEKYEEFATKKLKKYPMADTLVFLKVAGIMFPGTDYHHPVMTPVFTFLAHILGTAQVTTRREVVSALFCAQLLLEYLSEAKRFMPELINVLNGLLFICLPGSEKAKLPHTPPFKPVGPAATLLCLESKVTEFKFVNFKLSSLNNNEEEITDDFKISVLIEVLNVLKDFCISLSVLPAIGIIMSNTHCLLKLLPLEKYPKAVTCASEALQKSIDSLPRKYSALVKKAGKPQALRMYEPEIEKIVEGMKKRTGTREYMEKQKLIHKVKRERKGARREIQRDTSFLARQQLTEVLRSDAERKRKVNQIMGSLAFQESDHKKLKKLKKK